MDDEILFLYDEEAEKRNKLIKEIILELNKKPLKHYKEARFLKNFIKSIVIASKKENNLFRFHEPEFLTFQHEFGIEKPVYNKSVYNKIESPKKFEINEDRLIQPTPNNFIQKIEPQEFEFKIKMLEPSEKQKTADELPEPPKPNVDQGYKRVYTDEVMPEIKKTNYLDALNTPEPQKELKKSFVKNRLELTNNTVTYMIEEEPLDELSKRLYDKLESSIENPEKLQHLDSLIKGNSKLLNIPLEKIDSQRIKYLLNRKINGFGIIDPLMNDPDVKAVYCESLNIVISVDHVELGNIKTNLMFTDSFELNQLITNIARMAGRSIDGGVPMVEGVLRNGERFSLTLGTNYSNAKFSIIK